MAVIININFTPLPPNSCQFIEKIVFFDMEFKLIDIYADTVEASSKQKGAYILIIFVEKNKKISIGKLGYMVFRKGCYAYVGSAMGGLSKRIKVHINKNRKPRWHIDYLLKEAHLSKIILLITDNKIEDRVACLFEKNFEKIDKFGASDSKVCDSHLFFVQKENAVGAILKEVEFLKKLKLGK